MEIWSLLAFERPQPECCGRVCVLCATNICITEVMLILGKKNTNPQSSIVLN